MIAFIIYSIKYLHCIKLNTENIVLVKNVLYTLAFNVLLNMILTV